MKSIIAAAVVLMALAGTVGAQPRIVVDTDSIYFEANLETEGRDEVFNIENAGDGLLVWEARVEIVGEPEYLGNAGELLGEYQAEENSFIVGWDYDLEMMWILDGSGWIKAIYHHDYEDFIVRDSIEAGELNVGCALQGELYLAERGGREISRYQRRRLETYEIQFPVQDLAADSRFELLFVLNAETFDIHVISLDGNGSLEEEIGIIDDYRDYLNGNDIVAFDWASGKYGFQLWAAYEGSAEVYQLDVDMIDWNCRGANIHFSAFEDESNEWRSIAHDGRNIWTCDYDAGEVQMFDDGAWDRNWLDIEPLEGEVGSGADMDIVVLMDSDDHLRGEYVAELHIYSNDPDSPDVVIDITMRVIGYPRIVVEWSEEAGFPNEVNFNRQFGQFETGEIKTIPFSISNIGTNDLVLDNVSIANEHFTVDFEEQVVITVGEGREFDINFVSDDPGLVVGELSILSNDPYYNWIRKPVIAFPGPLPQMVTDADVMEAAPEGNSTAWLVNMINPGDADLIWQAEIEGLPRRDEANETAVTITPNDGVLEPDADVDLFIECVLVRYEREVEYLTLLINTNDPYHLTTRIPIRIRWPVEVEDEKQVEAPERFTLESVYPNPFNSSAAVRFGMAKEGSVRIRLLDLAGREVASLADGDYPAGSHKVEFDGHGLAAGIYLVRMESEGEARTTKAVLTR